MHKNTTVRQIAGALSDGMITINTQGIITSANPAIVNIFGYSEQELIGENINILMPDSVAFAHQSYLERAKVNETGLSLNAGRELSGKCKDGRIIPVSISVFAVETDKGERQLLGLVSDQSPRAAINEEKQKTRLLYKNIDLLQGVGLWRIDIATGFLEWSEQIYELHGLKVGEFTPTIETSLSYFHPDDIEDVRNCLTEAVTSGSNFEFRAKLIRTDGELRHVWSIGHVERDQNDKPIAIFGNIVDLTREKNREDTLSAINNQQNILNNILYEHSLSASPEDFFGPTLSAIVGYQWMSFAKAGALFLHDEKCNRSACCASEGVSEDDLATIGQFIDSAQSCDAPAGFNIQEIARQSETLGYLVLAKEEEIDLTRSDAMFLASTSEVLAICLDDLRKQQTISAQNKELRTRLAEVQALSQGFEKQAKALAKLSADLEDEKQKAEAASRSKSAFLANMSHEVRTPLNGVLGMLSMLEMSAIKGEERDCVNLAKEATYSALQLINDILDLSHLEAGKLTIINHEFTFETLAKRITAMVKSKAEAKGLLFEIVNELGDEVLVGDDLRIQQVIINLADNAIKFTEEGFVKVHIDRDHKTETIRLEVKDTGEGMTVEQTTRMFERFEQADPSNTRRHGGVGLGLSICKSLMEQMGGKIGVTSELGKGTRFIVEIPLQVATSKTPDEEETQVNGEDFSHELRILAAEDNRINQEILKRVSRMLELNITIVGDGKQAVEAMETGDYDIILMDIQMPVMDGMAATKALRANGHTIPIIAVSAHAMTGDKEHFLEQGFSGYVAKPYEVAHLLSEIERLTEEHENEEIKAAS
ncbi:MAG: ATP-binding protein [Parvibaculum sp.]